MADAITLDVDLATFSRRLSQFVAQTARDVDQVVFETAVLVLSDTQVGWPVDTGVSRAGWWGPRRLAPGVVQIGNPFRYAPVIEYGGYKSPGPKTAAFGPVTLQDGAFTINAGVYPRQRPAAPLRQALAQHYGRMTDELRKRHGAQWGR